MQRQSIRSYIWSSDGAFEGSCEPLLLPALGCNDPSDMSSVALAVKRIVIWSLLLVGPYLKHKISWSVRVWMHAPSELLTLTSITDEVISASNLAPVAETAAQLLSVSTWSLVLARLIRPDHSPLRAYTKHQCPQHQPSLPRQSVQERGAWTHRWHCGRCSRGQQHRR